MGEEEKKPAEEKKVEEKTAPPTEEPKKPAEEKKDNSEKPKGEDEKNKESGGGGEEKKADEASGDGKDSATEPPPPPPEIVLRVYMHCEGCARKVKRCLKGFNGVEDVTTDCKNHTVVVKGEKADPVKVLERVQKKSHRHVELLSPIPKPPAEEGEGEKKPEVKEEVPKTEEKKEEPKVITVVLKVHMHCEACAQEIKKRIERMKEVETATPDLKSSEVTVKGTFDPSKLVDYVYKRTGKQAIIIKQDPPPPDPEKKDEPGDSKGGEEAGKNENDSGGEKKEGGGGDAGEKKESGGGGGEGGGGSESPPVTGETVEDLERKVVEMRRNEYMYNNYPPRYAMEMYHAYPPQIFSDENPNACRVM